MAWGVALLVLAYLGVMALGRSEFVRRRLVQAVRSTSGLELTLRRLTVGWDLVLHADGVALAEAGQSPFLRVRGVRLVFTPAAALRMRAGTLTLDTPVLDLRRLPEPGDVGRGFDPADVSLPVDRIEVAGGRLRLGPDQPALGPLVFAVTGAMAGEHLTAEGRAEALGGDVTARLRLAVEPRAARYRAVISARTERLPQTLRRLTVGVLSRSLRGGRGTLEARLHGDSAGAELVLAARLAGVLPEVARLRGRARATSLDAASFSVEAFVGEEEVALLRAAGSLDRKEIDVRARVEPRPFGEAGEALGLPGLDGRLTADLHARGAWRRPRVGGTVEIRDLRLSEPEATVAQVRLPFEWDGGELRSTGAWTLREIDAKHGAFSMAVAEALWDGVVRPGASEWAADGRVVLRQGGFHDVGYRYAAEKVDLEGKLTVRRTVAPLQWRAGMDLEVASGELLGGRFYVDLGRHPARLLGRLDIADAGLDVSDGRLALEGVGRWQGRALWHPDDLRVSGRLTLPDVGGLVRLAVREPFRDLYPILDGLEASGRVELDGSSGLDASGARLDGGLAGSDLRLALEDAGLVVEAAGEIPVQIGTENGSMRSGWLRIDRVRFGDVEIPERAATFESWPDAYRLRGPVAFPVLGGQVVLSGINVSDLDGPERRGRLDIAIRELDLQELSAALGGPRLEGAMSGSFPGLTVADGGIRGEGVIRIEALGGTVEVRNLRIRDVFSRIPALELDLRFRGIRLDRLTDRLALGRVSGVVEGEVDDLVVVDGQPQSFTARLESVPDADVAQRISVRAIRQLSILGGAGDDPFTQGILSLFDEYRYARLGFHCRLRNDTFVLEGVERFEGRDYLVVGGFLPPRVNVISHNQRISFSEMMRRLRRIGAGTRGNGDER